MRNVALGSITMCNCLLMLTNGAMSPRLLGVVGLLPKGVFWVVIFLVLKRASSGASQLGCLFEDCDSAIPVF